MNGNKSYDSLLKKYEEYSILTLVHMILRWDFQTQMPVKGTGQRSKQFGMIEDLIHKRITDPAINDLLQKIKREEDNSSFTKVEKRNISLIERYYNRNAKIPSKLVEKIAKQRPKTIMAWKKAKKEESYQLFKPELIKLLELVKQRAQYLEPDKEPYEALLGEREPGMTVSLVTSLFDELKEGIIPLIQKCRQTAIEVDQSLVERHCPKELQQRLSEDIAKLIGFDLQGGRIGESEHPSTVGYHDDVRITTHYHEDKFTKSFYPVLHEGGHALYYQNLPREYIYQPVGMIVSEGIDESQSRFIENLIGRSYEFWDHYLPRLKELTGEIFADVELDQFIFAMNEVKPSKIRIFADELTYSLHIIIRFEIARDLLTGKITTDQLPEVWNKKYKEYLNVEIENDTEGVLQDIHWAVGLFGSFPSYVLGNIYNAQMLAKMRQEIPNYKDLIRKGNLQPIVEWLTKNVYQQANLYDPQDLIKNITGEELSSKYFLNYLTEKYSRIYRIEE